MIAKKRFTVSVTYPADDLLGTPENTESLVATTDLETLMEIWDPFYTAK